MACHYLQSLFEPEAVAVFGASERPGSVAGGIFRNLQEGGFAGRLHPINPRRESVFGVPCASALDGVGERVDLAIIATPPDTVAPIVRDCGAHGVANAVVISAGFGELGEAGSDRERELLAAARAADVRILGPNCLGLMRPGHCLNATFGLTSAAPGRIGLISQSGALCTAILDWAAMRHIGFSAVVSLGDAADIDFGDLIDYLAGDPDTRSILLYIEGVHQARPFVSALRSAARVKPVIVIKAGRHESGSRAALSHTGALAGNDDVFNAVLDRAGAVRVATIGQLFSAAQILSEYAGEAGRRLAIVTNAGGPGVLAADRAADLDIELPAPDEALAARLQRALPATAAPTNPLDLRGDAPPDLYEAAVEACLDAPGLDGVLVILTPQAMTDPLVAAEAVIAARQRHGRPLLTSWMGGERVEAARRRFYEQGVPHFPSPEAAVEAFAYLARRRRNRELLMQVPGPRPQAVEPDVDAARAVIDGALADGRELLSGSEARRVLAAFGVPANPAAPAATPDEAAAQAEALGLPVAMKIDSPDVAHKSDVSGVRLGLADAESVRAACADMLARVAELAPAARIAGVTLEPMYAETAARELVVGVARDPVFGPVISFGAGGKAVEILRDRSLALPPLNELIAKHMIDDTRVSGMLGDWRDLRAIDRADLVDTLLAVSTLACELPQVVELDLNPLMASPAGVLALDARIVVAPFSRRRYEHMAIHPFPTHRVAHFTSGAGRDVTIRPIRPEDAELEQAFVRGLSETSRYPRFMGTMHELTSEVLVRYTQIDYDREMALIAVGVEQGVEIQLGVARYAMTPDGHGCEFAIAVADDVQNTGIGKRLLQDLIAAARDRGLHWMGAQTFAGNAAMCALARGCGFDVRPHDADPGLAELRLVL